MKVSIRGQRGITPGALGAAVMATDLKQLLTPANLILARPLVPAHPPVKAIHLVPSNPPLPAHRLVPALQLVPALLPNEQCS